MNSLAFSPSRGKVFGEAEYVDRMFFVYQMEKSGFRSWCSIRDVLGNKPSLPADFDRGDSRKQGALGYSILPARCQVSMDLECHDREEEFGCFEWLPSRKNFCSLRDNKAILPQAYAQLKEL